MSIYSPTKLKTNNEHTKLKIWERLRTASLNPKLTWFIQKKKCLIRSRRLICCIKIDETECYLQWYVDHAVLVLWQDNS